MVNGDLRRIHPSFPYIRVNGIDLAGEVIRARDAHAGRHEKPHNLRRAVRFGVLLLVR
jgi:hypothetical protein